MSEVVSAGQPYDVVIVGGGTSGAMAAIQAGRAGARVLLVEMEGQLGGVTTVGGVSFPGLFHAWGRQIIAGIGWELVCKAVELDSGTMPDFDGTPEPRRHWEHQVRINGPLYAALAEEACIEAGVDLWYYAFPLNIEPYPDGWALDIAGPGFHQGVACRQLVDCTGGADITGMAGFERVRGEETQPGTLIFRLGGYDVTALDADLIQERFQKAIQDGRLQPADVHHAKVRFIDFLASGGENAQHVLGADSSSAATRTRANIAGRASVLRLLRFTRTLPGCEHARLLKMQQQTGVRESYRIVGDAMVTCEDYLSGRVCEDAIAYSFYPIDLHDQHGVVPKLLQRGIVPTVPYRALLPRGSRNLIVAGRSISSDRLANSALRVQATCMATGQVAGAAAALAARSDGDFRSVPLSDLRDLLKAHGAIVPEPDESHA